MKTWLNLDILDVEKTASLVLQDQLAVEEVSK